ncbi:unnamed protein product, partial [Prunus brigantina]
MSSLNGPALRALLASKASPCKRGPKARFKVPAAKFNPGMAWGPPTWSSPQANPTCDAAWASDTTGEMITIEIKVWERGFLIRGVGWGGCERKRGRLRSLKM